MNISEVSDGMATTLLMIGRSPITVKCYQGRIGILIAETGDIPFTQLTRQRVEKHIVDRLAAGFDPGTMCTTVAAIRAMTKYAHREGLIPEDWGLKLRYLKIKDAIPRALEETDVIRLINEWPIQKCLQPFETARDRAMIAFALFTGARAKEVTGVTIHDLDLEKRIVALQETKGRVPRLIPLHSELISILEDYIQHRLKIPIPLKDLPYLFISRQSGRPWTKMTPNNYVTRFIHHADKLGIDATSHSMRHTFATTLIENDVDISVVQQLLGHKDISTTVRYLKVRTKKKREAVARLPFKLK